MLAILNADLNGLRYIRILRQIKATLRVLPKIMHLPQIDARDTAFPIYIGMCAVRKFIDVLCNLEDPPKGTHELLHMPCEMTFGPSHET